MTTTAAAVMFFSHISQKNFNYLISLFHNTPTFIMYRFCRARCEVMHYGVVRCLSVYLSARLSVTFVYCIERVKDILKLFHRRVATPF